MTGFVGGLTSERTRDAMLERLHREDWYGTDRAAAGDVALGIYHHGDRDPGGHDVRSTGDRLGLVYGAINNPEAVAGSRAELYDRVLDDPLSTLPKLDGNFVIVVADADADEVVVATDKLGTRPCYYATDPLVFGSNVGALLESVGEPTVDERAIGDMLMIGQVWGEKTLVREVGYLPPGSVLRSDGDGLRIDRYHEFAFGQSESPSYVDGLVEAYRRAVGEMSGTIDGEAGLWLSGGMDSRAMAHELRKHRDLVTYTYDANPPQGGNLEQAAKVADVLGVANEQVPLSAEGFAEVFDESVAITNGMIGLSTFVNLSAVWNLPADRPGVVIEACGQGGMMGDGIGRASIERSDSPERALYDAKHVVDVDEVRRLLETDFDPMDTYRREVARSDQADHYTTVMDVYFRNYFPRGDFASNPLARSQVGTRVPFAHSGWLERITKLPLRYRVKPVPLTGGKIPYATSPLKIELVRRQDHGLEEIPYQRTKVAPERPLWQHAAGFVVGTAIDRLRGRRTYGGKSLVGEWYRTPGAFQTRVDELLYAACDRPYLDGAEVRRLRREHLDGDGERIAAISGIVTAESWLQQYVD